MQASGIKPAARFGYPVLLAALFVVSFAVPVLFAVRVLGVLGDGADRAPAESFQNAREIRGGASQLQVLNSGDLQPVEGEDFLLTGWFKLLRLPKPGERVILFTKYDGAAPAFAGYAVELQRKGEDLVPLVYWRDGRSTGRWYYFSKVRIVPKSWFMVALSFQDNKALGLHIASMHLYEEERLQLLGGYNFDPPILPYAAADLRIGGQGSLALRGTVGPIGVFIGKQIPDDYQTLYSQMVERPMQIPPQLEESVRFWSIDGRRDLTSAGRKIHKAASVSRGRGAVKAQEDGPELGGERDSAAR